MDAKHIINIQGKEYVLFTGLLDEAHHQGLSGIEASLIQTPTPEQDAAIVLARVTTEKGTFTGIGDASPKNVNRMVAGALIRMAETRAVARALRFATNIGITAFEELDAEERPGGGCDLGELKTDIHGLEKTAHKNAAEAKNSRKKHLGVESLADCDDRKKLITYRTRLREKINERE